MGQANDGDGRADVMMVVLVVGMTVAVMVVTVVYHRQSGI